MTRAILALSHDPVAAYGFDEGTGTTLSDHSGNGHDGVLGNQSWVLGRFGNALAFDDDWVTVADSNDLDLQTAGTWSAWVKPFAEQANWPTILMKEGVEEFGYALFAQWRHEFGARQPPASFVTSNGQYVGVIGGTSRPPGKWSHIASTYDGEVLHLYVNGELAGSTVLDVDVAVTSGPLRIGGNSVYPNEFFHGALDEIRIYDRALSRDEIRFDMYTAIGDASPSAVALVAPENGSTVSGTVETRVFVRDPAVARIQFLVDGVPSGAEDTAPPFERVWDSTSTANGTHTLGAEARNSAGQLLAVSTTSVIVNNGLVAAYGFDEGGGFTVSDGTGNAHDGAIDGQSWVGGKFGTGLEFQNSFITVADSDLLDLRTLTVSAWVKPLDQQDSFVTILMKEGDPTTIEEYSYSIFGEWTDEFDDRHPPSGFVVSNNGYYGASGGAFGQIGEWTHLASTYDGTALTFYVNGELVDSRPLVVDVVTTAGPLRIGGNTLDPNQFFRGVIDEVRVYNRALSQAEIQAAMDSPLECAGAIDDGNPCTVDACSPSGVPTHTPAPNGTSCSDGNGCTPADSCQSGVCVGSAPTPCAPLDACHDAGICDPSTGACSNPAKADGTPCLNGTVCDGAESCQAGVCSPGTPVAIDDGNPCTSDGCDATSGVTHIFVSTGTSCENADLCDGIETCDGAGTCVAGTPPAIEDGNPCTIDACDPISGISHMAAPLGTVCDDGNVCNGVATCDGAAVCIAGVPPVTDDDNPCTLDGCEPASGPTHAPITAGTSCGDSDVCNGDERCNAVGACVTEAAPVIDDGNRCTTDACDPIAGVTHTAISGCDLAPSTQGSRLETRASILGRVQTAAGAPVSNFSIAVYDAPDSGPASSIARSDVAFTTAADGSFRVRLTDFPEAAAERAPAQRVLVRLSSEAFPRLTREARLRPGELADLGVLTVLERDPTVTNIGPAGGTAHDSQNLVELQIPAGALASMQPIRVTPIQTREQFPTPLPDATVTMYGVVLEPDGLEFSQPVAVRFANYRSFPTTLTIPMGTVDESTGRWVHEGSGTWDGQRFRAEIRHFSPHDLNLPTAGEWVVSVQRGADPNKSNCDREVGSSASMGTGALRQSVSLPSVARGGIEQALTLVYDSGLAGSRSYARPGSSTGTSGVLPSSGFRIPIGGVSVSLDCQAPGGGSSGSGCGTGIPCAPGVVSPGYLSNRFNALGRTSETTETVTQPIQSGSIFGNYIDLPLNEDGSTPVPSFVKVEDSITVSNPLGLTGGLGSAVSECVASGGVFGVQSSTGTRASVRSAPAPQVKSSRYELAYHRRGAAAGNGWGIAEIGEAFVPPDRAHVDLIQGSGYREHFTVRGEATVVARGGTTGAPLSSRSIAMNMAREPVTGELLFAPGSSPGTSIRRVNPAGTVDTLVAVPGVTGTAHALAIAYSAAGRRFMIASTTGLFEVTEAGAATLLRSRSGTAQGIFDRPSIAADGSHVYYVSGVDDFLYHVDLDDPMRTVEALSATSTSGDVQLDPRLPLGQVWLETPRALAFAPDGSLYVACTNRHTLYRLAPQSDGVIGEDSAVTRVVGDGSARFSQTIGSKAPALAAPLRAPHQLAVASDGQVFIVTPGILYRYDPVEASLQSLAGDRRLIYGDFTRFEFSNNGSIVAKDSKAVYVKEDSLVLIDFGKLASDVDPTRVIEMFPDRLVLTDRSAEHVQTYGFHDSFEQHARLIEERRRTGELLRTVSYDSAGRPEFIDDAWGGRTTLTYAAGGKLSTIRDAGGRTTTLTVDANGDLTSVALPGGDSFAYSYSFGRMLTARNDRGEVSTYTYSENGTLDSATKPGGAVSRVTAALSSHQYTSTGATVYSGSYIDPRGVEHTIETDLKGNISVERYVADGQSYELRRIPAPVLEGTGLGPTSALDRRNSMGSAAQATLNGVPITPYFTLDDFGRVLREQTGSISSASVYTSVYDQNGRLARIDPTEGNLHWFFEYDAQGHPSRSFDGNNSPSGPTVAGRLRAFTWNLHGQLETSSHHQSTATIAYDATTGNVETVSELGAFASYTYDASGNVKSENDGHTTIEYDYDDRGRVTTVRDAAANETHLTYTDPGCGCSNGSLVSTLQTPDLPADRYWMFDYDADGRLLQATDPYATIAALTYSSAGDLASARDGLSRTSNFTNDSLGRRTTIVDHTGRVTTFAYPVPVSGVWQGAAISAASPDTQPAPTSLIAALRAGEFQVGFSHYGEPNFPPRVEFYRDPTLQFSFGSDYDAARRLTRRGDRSTLALGASQVLPASGGDLERQTFGYDILSPFPLLTVGDTQAAFGARHELDYDSNLDLLSGSGWTLSSTNAPFSTNAQYGFFRDVTGRLTRVTTRFVTDIPGTGSDVITAPDTTYSYNPTTGYLEQLVNGTGTQAITYDARGLIDTLTLSFAGTPAQGNVNAGTFLFDHDEVGRNTRLEYPGGHVRTQRYDLLGRLLERCYEYTSGERRCYTAEYDAIGNPTVLTDPEGSTEVDYDEFDRVVSVQRSNGTGTSETETYTYNAAGGFSLFDSQLVSDQRPRLDGSGNAPSGLPAAHAGTPIAIDALGRVTSALGGTFNYGAASPSALDTINEGTRKTILARDTFQRIASLSTLTGGSLTADDGATHFLYEGPEVVGTWLIDVNPANGQRRTRLGTRVLPDPTAFDHPLWAYDGSNILFYELDTLGNVRRLRGGPLGPSNTLPAPADLGGYRYSAFGKLRPADTATPAPAIGGQPLRQNFLWQGRWFIPDTAGGIYHFRSRIWSPQIGAFLRADEVQYLGRTGTLWSWPGQNPYRWADPSGHVIRSRALDNQAESASLMMNAAWWLVGDARTQFDRGNYGTAALNALAVIPTFLLGILQVPGNELALGPIGGVVTPTGAVACKEAAAAAARGGMWTATKNKTVAQNALRHFKDHGAGFGAQNAADYVRQAQQFLRSPPPGTLTRVRPNGDVVRYNPGTNTFGVMDANGAPRTLFKPDPAVHGYRTSLEYFNAQ